MAEQLQRAVDYLGVEAPGMEAEVVLSKLRKALADLVETARELSDQPASAGDEWTPRHIVDHIAQTNIRAASELRQLAAGRTPPLPPVYEGLRSGAPARVPWDELLQGLAGSCNELMLAARAASEGPPNVARVNAVIVLEGTSQPAWLEWKGYTMLQRLHAIEHRNELRR